MSRKLFVWAGVLVALGASTNFLQADQIVEDTHVVLAQTSADEFRFTINQSAVGGDETSIFFEQDSTSAATTLFMTSINVDEASEWFLVEEDDVFTRQTICNDEHEFWGGTDKSFDLILGNSLQLSVGEHFLGLNTGQGFEGGPYNDMYPKRDVFGWVKILVTPNQQIEMVDNAVSYGGKGIIIGQNRPAVPEPCSASLLVVLGLLVTSRRNK